MNEPGLFDDPPRSRPTDPATSKKAGASVPSQFNRILFELRCFYRSRGRWPTANELGYYMGTDVWRRMGELQTMGKVVRLAPRICQRSGRPAAGWKPKGEI